MSSALAQASAVNRLLSADASTEEVTASETIQMAIQWEEMRSGNRNPVETSFDMFDDSFQRSFIFSESVDETTQQRVETEVAWLKNDKPAGFNARPSGDNSLQWIASIDGPEDSVYEGGRFYLDIKLPHEYPYSPPEARFSTPIYHPNLKQFEIIRTDVFENWNTNYTIGQFIESIIDLMLNPVVENEDRIVQKSIAETFAERPEDYNRAAVAATATYAGSLNSDRRKKARSKHLSPSEIGRKHSRTGGPFTPN